jgi:hypothetical protein
LNCHQGRQSTVSVNSAIADMDLDTVSEDLGFQNVHYFAAGATLFGTEAKGAYEYDGKSYLGRFAHVESFDTCTECHDAHALEIDATTCSTCHSGVEDPRDIRMSDVDFDGNGDVEEGLAREIETAHDALYVAIQEYGTEIAGMPIVYDSHSYPYWFTDEGEGYANWTPRLLQAAYNYQYVAKDPGAFAHNGKYIIQILYDSLESLGARVSVDLTGATRPASE